MRAIRPQAGPQEAFLSTSADVAIYGGAAGGGKTWSLLLEPLRHISTVDGFGAVIFRRTSPQITNEGGLWDESERLYPTLGAMAREYRLEWSFPPHDNVIKFAHMQHEKNRLDWQGSQIALIGFDELTHFTRGQFMYMFSRNRSTCGIRPYIRAGCNPIPDDDPTGGWIHELIGWYIGDDGYAIPERSGVVRWFVVVDDTFIWSRDHDNLRSRYPHIEPKSFTFVHSSVYDNKILLEKDPGYLANLQALPLVERGQLLDGNWHIKPEAGTVFNRAWFRLISRTAAHNETFTAVVRFWDIAATEKQIGGRRKNDPDYTVGVLMGKATDGRYIVLDVDDFQEGPTERDKRMRRVSNQDAAAYGRLYRVAWEKQPAAAGKSLDIDFYRMFDGLNCYAVMPRGDKVLRAGPFASQAEGGMVYVVDAEWTNRYLRWLHGFPDLAHDDHVDASSGAHFVLSGELQNLPDQPVQESRWATEETQSGGKWRKY